MKNEISAPQARKKKREKEYIFINLIPELVEKKDPPIITNIKKIKAKLSGVSFKEIPIFEMLLVKEKKIDEKS